MIFICSLFLFSAIFSTADIGPEVMLYTELQEQNYIVYADNPEPCPVSILVKYELSNLKSEKGKSYYTVLPAFSKKVKLDRLDVKKKNREFSVTLEYTSQFGDIYADKTEEDYVYRLPFSNGEELKIGQGYNGQYSHVGKYALDFNMDEGTAVHAMRAGRVIEVIDGNTQGCPHQECLKYSNMIIVYHSDGSMAKYSHLQHKGAKVIKGQYIEAGEMIAKSGNTGWSSGPHLHIEIYRASKQGEKSFPTLFSTGENPEGEYLETGKIYAH